MVIHIISSPFSLRLARPERQQQVVQEFCDGGLKPRHTANIEPTPSPPAAPSAKSALQTRQASASHQGD